MLVKLCKQAERAKKSRDGDGRDVSAETPNDVPLR